MKNNFYYSNCKPENTKIFFFILSLAKRFKEYARGALYGYGTHESLKKLCFGDIKLYEHKPFRIILKSFGLFIEGVGLYVHASGKFFGSTIICRVGKFIDANSK